MGLNKKIKVSSEVEARCTKCKINTSHTVVAMQGDEIKKVECLVCTSTHKYIVPREAKPKAEPALTAAQKARAAEASDWQSAVAERAEDVFKPYQMDGLYTEGDLIRHPAFGNGQVKRIDGTHKMEVLFAEGTRRLVFNRARP